MKNFLRFACIAICFFLQAQLFANTVIVKGTVKDSANNAVAGRTVKIYSTDSSNNGCILSHTTVTNANGYYIDTLTCNGDIRKLAIIVENCDGVKITHDPAVTTSNIVESNFIICKPANTTGIAACRAAYSYTSLPGGVKFNGAGSFAPAGDSIISRVWSFGDTSAALTGNITDPTHAYSKPGIYSVCLTIKTKNGCESKFCGTVAFTPASNECSVQAVFSAVKTSGRIFQFDSKETSVLVGDSIFQRIWKLGDGTSVDGNQAAITKEYKDTGVYNVCLTVNTMKGCTKQYCLTVVVRDSVRTPLPQNCKAGYNYNSQGTTLKFVSTATAAAGDSIISRIWLFGDNTPSVTGNRIDPSHAFARPGNYNVCIYIKTAAGCESNFCQNIEVKDSVNTPPNCKAIFTYSIKDSVITFNSADSRGSSSADSIISRTWYYSDSTTSVSLPGNVVAPSYPFTKPGSYPVTLVIKTASGCESKFTGTVIIAPKPAVTNCKSYFSSTVVKNTAAFNSSKAEATSAQDSIISRIWLFGDNTAALQGNTVNPSHEYTKPGTYHAMLYIKTKTGCESKYEADVVIAAAACEVKVQFSAEKTGLKKIQFNSSLTTTAAGDSITQRNWNFGDNTTLGGNEISPMKEYSYFAFFNTCLQVKTANGCEAKLCKEVLVQDTVTTPQSSVEYIKIIAINPNPVITRMMATIYSRNTNAETEISIYDIYGNPKMNIKKLLSQGNNIIEIATDFLPHGPYFLKASTKNGKDTKAFYKL